MAIGKASDFKIYQDEFQTGMTEILDQHANGFNAASNGAISLVTMDRIGDYAKEAFFKSISGLVSRRDATSVAAATDTALTQGENASAKILRKIGPVANTLDSLRKIASNQSEFSMLLGQQIGQAVAEDYINTGILAGNTALSGVAGLNYDYSATGTLNHTAMISGMAKLGDRAQQIACWVMHSKSFFDLMQNAVTANVYQVGGAVIMEGSVATFGKPVLVTDCSDLINTTPTPDTYDVLGLVAGGIKVEETEGREVVSEVVTGLENLVVRIQGEHAFNVGVKGFAYDYANGGANPNDTAIGTASNWDQSATSTKDCAGVRITVQ